MDKYTFAVFHTVKCLMNENGTVLRPLIHYTLCIVEKNFNMFHFQINENEKPYSQHIIHILNHLERASLLTRLENGNYTLGKTLEKKIKMLDGNTKTMSELINSSEYSIPDQYLKLINGMSMKLSRLDLDDARKLALNSLLKERKILLAN